MEDAKIIVNELRHHAMNRDVKNVKQLSKHTEVSYPTLSRWFGREPEDMRLGTLVQVCNYLGLEILIKEKGE